MTKQMLRRAFTRLLMEKPIQNITVRELCEQAQVNRGTFYVHYTDIYDLMESIEKEMTEELMQVLKDMNVSPGSMESLVEPCQKIFEFLKNNSDMCTIFLGENSDFAFVNRLIELGRESSLKQYLQCYPNATRKQAEYFYSFASSGYIGILRQWAANNFQDSEAWVTAMTKNLMLGAAQALKTTLEAP